MGTVISVMRKSVHAFIPPVVFFLGLILVIFGIWRGEPHDILQKAVVVCMECIGIG